jgi:hypothetical protein
MIRRLARRLRYGKPIVIVSGLPRSGTSMMMRMLDAGGLAPLEDGVRTADVSNPKGYFEFEPVKELESARGDVAWLPAARGKAVKVISLLLTWLPEHYNYRVIFMQRDLDEVLASQQQMLERRGEDGGADAGRSRDVFQAHLTQVERFMAARPCFETLHVPYREAVGAPAATAVAVARFLGRRMDTDAMARAVEASLYHHRT